MQASGESDLRTSARVKYERICISCLVAWLTTFVPVPTASVALSSMVFASPFDLTGLAVLVAPLWAAVASVRSKGMQRTRSGKPCDVKG
jgi:hypothetical protein